MLNRFCVRIMRFCGVAVALWSVSAAAGIAIVSPSEDQVVPLLTEAQRAYVKTPRETREPWFADNKAKRSELRKIGSKPNPVRVAWTGADGQPVTVTVFKLPKRESVYSFSGKTNELAIFNLEIARDYAVEVAAGRDKATRRFKTEDLAPRFMDVPNIGNMRDLGGRVGLDGRRVKQGRIYRSAGWNSNAVWPMKKIKDKNGKKKKVVDESRPPVAGTNRLTSAGRDYALNVLGIKSDIDLRKDSECWGMTGSPIGPEVTWFHYSYLGYSPTASAAGKKAFANVFRVLLDEKNYPLVFHCIGGADRTGTVAFILNALLGCAEEELYLDWEVTGFKGGVVDSRHRKWFLGLVRKIGQFEGANWSEKAASYVRSCGFTDADIAKFRSMMLEERRK